MDQTQDYQKALDDYAKLTSTEPAPPVTPSLPAETLASPTPPVTPPLRPTSVSIPIKTNSGFDIFKYAFFLSLIIFLGVVATLGYNLYKQYFNNPPTTPPTASESPTPSVVATPTSTAVCQLNDQDYHIGQSFPAADGCNTCTCGPDLTISCTDLDCSSVTPTSATSSSVPADWKTYENKNLGFSLQYPLSFSKKDNLQTKLTSTPLTTNTLSLTDDKNEITISIMINPDGFGYFPDKDIKIAYQSGKGIISTATETNTENIDPTKILNIYTGNLKTGFNFLAMVSFPRTENTSSIESTITQILSTFKFL